MLTIRKSGHWLSQQCRSFTSSVVQDSMPLITRSHAFEEREAITDPSGKVYSYSDLLQLSSNIASRISSKRSIEGQRVAFLCKPGINYVATQWAIWRSGAVAVPLCVSHPLPEMLHVVNNAQVCAVVHDTTVAELPNFPGVSKLISESVNPMIESFPLPPLGSVSTEEGATHPFVPSTLPSRDSESGAMIVYTSGTTGLPKGVVTRHSALEAQISDLVTSWKWSETDRILHFLPLHHVHGIVNKLCCPLSTGAHVEFMDSFNAKLVWKRLADTSLPPITVFMGVPTIYTKMIAAYDEEQSEEVRQRYSEACKRVRLMVSGSAALPVGVFNRWKEISGHRLLERYGMTEFGMGISNPLEPEEGRLPGYVGQPLPSAQVAIKDETTGETIKDSNVAGGLCIRGPIVFKEYWNNPEATSKDFDEDGWFHTGDEALYDAKAQSFRILGRASIDIIKSGGYKISALHVEQVMLDSVDVKEIAVVGLPDEVYGQQVAAVVVLSDEATVEQVVEYAKANLPSYSVPQTYKVVSEMPRNAMGKVNKKTLVVDVDLVHQ